MKKRNKIWDGRKCHAKAGFVREGGILPQGNFPVDILDLTARSRQHFFDF